jgi:RNA polymerase sigma factor (TIGR02999 family)
MEENVDGELTAILAQWTAERPEPPPQLLALVYRDLRRIAAGYMRRERPDHTLQATALVHEAYLRVFHGEPFRWENRRHFFSTVSRTMRRILIDYARNRKAEIHGGDLIRVGLEDITVIAEQRPARLIDLDRALEELERLQPRQAEVVELRWFVGITEKEIAETLGVSEKTVQNDWSFARVWLQHRLAGVGSDA